MWQVPEHIAGALITLFGSVFAILWAWGIKERKRQTALLAVSIETMLKGYHELIADMEKMLAATRAEISQTRDRANAQCEAQLLDLEMILLKDMRDQQSAYLATIAALERQLSEITSKCGGSDAAN